MKLNIYKDSTSNLLEFFVQDITNSYGIGKTGLVYSDFSIYYHRNKGTASVSATPTATASTIGTWETLKTKEIDATNMKGVYQYGAPDAAFITGTDGSTSVSFLISDTNATARFAPIPLEIQLLKDTSQPFNVLNQTLIKNTGSQYVYFFIWDNVTNAPATVANINANAGTNTVGAGSAGACAIKCYYSLDNGTFTDVAAITTVASGSDTTSGAGNPDGLFRCPLSQAQTNGDVIIFNPYVAANTAQTTPLARFTARTFLVRTISSYQYAKLTSDGLDLVSTTLPGSGTALSAMSYRERTLLSTQRFLGKHSKTPTTLSIFDNSDVLLKTQDLTDDGSGTESVSAIS